MRQINNQSCVHSHIHTFYTWISCVENMFNTWINVLMDEVRTYEWMNVTWISHLSLNSCVKCIFNAWYYCMKHINYEWTNFAWFPLLGHEMLSLWFINVIHYKVEHFCHGKFNQMYSKSSELENMLM